MEIALVLTAHCNASCGHCSTSCGPYREEALSQDDVLRLMNEAAAIDDRQPLAFHITGGEPFVDFDRLLSTVSHGKHLQARVTCVTNAFWARSPEETRRKLTLLAEAGLGLLAVSVSRFHERYVPLRRVRLALEIAESLALTTQLKGAVTTSDLEANGALSRWKKELRANQIAIFPVLPYLREGAPQLADSEYCRLPGLPTDACPDDIVCIDADGTALSCCGQKRSTGFLQIGSIHAQSLADLRSRFECGGRQRILREQGPVAFARGATAAGYGHLLRDSYAGPCDLCVHIATQPELRNIADRMSAAFETTDPSTHSNKGTLMTVISLEYLQILLTKAATNAQFAELLLHDPKEAAKQAGPFDLTSVDVDLISAYKEPIQRIVTKSIDPDDAKYWAVGLLTTTIARVRNEPWTVSFRDIPMIENRSKGDDWKTRYLDIPMTPHRPQP